MSNNNTAVAATGFEEIERLANHGAMVFQGAPSITQSMQLAETVERLRAELTPQRMAKIMALMNTSLGFDTDRNPAKWTKPEPCVPYSVEVVRDVFIEASFRGFYPINCEFNIIAGRFYGGVNGFERLVKKHPKVTDFKDTYSVPVMQGEKGAIVKASAMWRQRGESGEFVDQSLERDFAVRMNAGMGADGVTGKAKRKLLAAVYARLSGVVTPEGEDEVTDLKGGNTATGAATPEQLFGTRQAGAESTPATAKAAPQPAAPAAASPVSTPETAKSDSPETPQQELGRFLTESGVSFDAFRDFLRIKGIAKDPDAWATFDEVPEKVCAWFKVNTKTMAELVRKFGNVQAK